MCQQNTEELLLSGDEDDTTSSDEEDAHNALNFFLDVVAQDSLGKLVGGFSLKTRRWQRQR